MLVSPDVYVPFVDRGGLMGFEILPWNNGDEEKYEVFEITSDARWVPRQYLEDDPGETIKDVMVANQDNEEFQDALQDHKEKIKHLKSKTRSPLHASHVVLYPSKPVQ